MRLPGLPTTKSNVISRAEKEGWRYEEQKGIGGTRRAYELPARYLSKDGSERHPEADDANKIVGTIVAGSAKVDTELLQLVVRTLKEWTRQRHIELPADKEAALIAVLYDYVSKGATEEELANLLKAAV